MTWGMKNYYLMQFSYWLQQLLVLALRLEKPRKDFVELVIHHLVTLWLIGYLIFVVTILDAVLTRIIIVGVML
jgi:very-long-chain ceramide synthase